MSKFIVGQRVVVEHALVHFMQGRRYYGHVVDITEPEMPPPKPSWRHPQGNPWKVALYGVQLIGCLGEPNIVHDLLTRPNNPMPFFESELVAID